MEVSGQLHFQPASPLFPFSMRLGVPQNLSEPFAFVQNEYNTTLIQILSCIGPKTVLLNMTFCPILSLHVLKNITSTLKV
jgi:hypothetical protein